MIKKVINPKINKKNNIDHVNNFFNNFDLGGFLKEVKTNIIIQKTNKMIIPIIIEYKKSKNI